MIQPLGSPARSRSRWSLLAGDLLCLAAFVLLGLRSHAELAQAGVLQRFAINLGPLAVAWVAAGLALGAFRLPVPVSVRAVLARTLAAWLVAAPLALLLRAMLLGSPTIAVAFLLVTLGVGGALLLIWRVAYAWWAARQ